MGPQGLKRPSRVGRAGLQACMNTLHPPLLSSREREGERRSGRTGRTPDEDPTGGNWSPLPGPEGL